MCERDCLLESNGKDDLELDVDYTPKSSQLSNKPPPRTHGWCHHCVSAHKHPLERQYAPSHNITKVSPASSICTLVQACCHGIAGASRCPHWHIVQTVGIAEASQPQTTQFDLALDQSHPHTAWCRKSVPRCRPAPACESKANYSSWYRWSVPQLFLELEVLPGNARRRTCPPRKSLTL